MAVGGRGGIGRLEKLRDLLSWVSRRRSSRRKSRGRGRSHRQEQQFENSRYNAKGKLKIRSSFYIFFLLKAADIVASAPLPPPPRAPSSNAKVVEHIAVQYFFVISLLI